MAEATLTLHRAVELALRKEIRWMQTGDPGYKSHYWLGAYDSFLLYISGGEKWNHLLRETTRDVCLGVWEYGTAQEAETQWKRKYDHRDCHFLRGKEVASCWVSIAERERRFFGTTYQVGSRRASRQEIAEYAIWSPLIDLIRTLPGYGYDIEYRITLYAKGELLYWNDGSVYHTGVYRTIRQPTVQKYDLRPPDLVITLTPEEEQAVKEADRASERSRGIRRYFGLKPGQILLIVTSPIWLPLALSLLSVPIMLILGILT